MCWAEANPGMRKIECSNMDGSNRNVLVQNEGLGHMFGIVMDSTHIYVTAWSSS